MELMVVNGQVGISSFERNRTPFGFLKVSLNPNSRIALHREKLKKKLVFSAKASDLIDSGRSIEKQFEFQPAFDEYLKAMESVKTVREKIPVRDGEEGLELGQMGEKNGKDTKFGEERTKLGWGRGVSKRDEVGRRITQGSGRQEFEYRDDGMDVRYVKGMREDGREDGMDVRYVKGMREDGRSMDKINRRWTNDVTTKDQRVQRKFEYGKSENGLREGEASINGTNGRWMNGVTKNEERRTYKNSNADMRHGSDEDSDGEDLDQKRKYTVMQKKKRSLNDSWPTASGREAQRMTNFSGIRKWLPEGQRSYRSSTESKTNESTLDRTLMDWEERSRRGRGVEFGETDNWKAAHVKELPHRSETDKQTCDFDIRGGNEREGSYRSRIGIRSDRNVFKTEKLGSAMAHVTLDKDHSHTEGRRAKIPLKGGNITRSSRFSKEDVDENDVDMEMAAFKSFEVFTDVRGQPRVLRMEMEERIQNLAKWLNGTDIDMPQWLFSKMMHSARIRFSDHSILRVIQILGTFGNWRRVLQVIEWLQSRERFKSYKSRFIYTTALDVLGKAKRPVEALNVFHSMREGVSSYPDLAAYHCIAVILGQAGHTKELFDVIDVMRSPPQKKFNTGYIENWDPRLEPDVVVYNAVLNACARRKQWEGAFWVLQQLKQQNIQPSSTTYGLVMEGMFVCAKYNLVYEFFRKVEKSYIPNSLNYKVLVNTLWKEGKTDDAVFAVQDMEKRGVVGSASLYYDLARCLCSAGRCQEALMQMDKICKVAHKPLVVTYTGLIQACLDAGNVRDGAYIFKEMQEFCFPNLVTCNIMLKAYIEHKMFDDAKNLFQKMLDDSCHISRKSDYKNIVNPDIYTFNTMLDACAAEQEWDDFGHVFQLMLHRGYNFNAKRHLRLILEACRAGKGELLETTWKYLVKADRLPPPPIVKERFCIKLEKNDYTDAISMITRYPTDNLKLHAFSEKGWLDLLEANTNRLQKNTILSLTHKLNSLIAGNDHPHPVIQNLFLSCKEFIRTQFITEINPTEIRESSSVI